jgi:AraC-like DNA-binding protein
MVVGPSTGLTAGTLPPHASTNSAAKVHPLRFIIESKCYKSSSVDMTALPDSLSRRPGSLLSEALASLELAGALFLRGEFSSPFALLSSPGETLAHALVPGTRRVILFHVVLEGRLVVSLDGADEELGPGDVAILPYADQHLLRSPEKARAIPIGTLFPPRPWSQPPRLRHGGGGATTSIACGYLYSDDLHLSPVLAAMPALIVVRPGPGRFSDWLTTNVRFALGEQDDLLMRRLPELLFLKCLDLHAVETGSHANGWLAAAADRVVGRAMARMHREPAHPWSLQKLARASGASRSVLDERFHRLVGCPPMQYLSSWRLQLAARKLNTGNATVAEVARAVGYGSEASFSRAFKRRTGVSPSEWRRQRTQSHSGHC